LFHMLHEHLGNEFYKLKTFLFNTYPDGFYVYAKSNMNSKSSDSSLYHSIGVFLRVSLNLYYDKFALKSNIFTSGKDTE